MKLFKRRKRESVVQNQTLYANYPEFEPGTRVRVNSAPPGLEHYPAADTAFLDTYGTVVFIEDAEFEIGDGVVIRFTADEFPLQLREGFDTIDLVFDPETVEVSE